MSQSKEPDVALSYSERLLSSQAQLEQPPVAGYSLLVMNSHLEKEGQAGPVQDGDHRPAIRIRYGSNPQPFINKREVKDVKDEDLTQEPEMIKAFGDPWERGIHSYLAYLRPVAYMLRVRNQLAAKINRPGSMIVASHRNQREGATT